MLPNDFFKPFNLIRNMLNFRISVFIRSSIFRHKLQILILIAQVGGSCFSALVPALEAKLHPNGQHNEEVCHEDGAL
jgi:hypothetical protein